MVEPLALDGRAALLQAPAVQVEPDADVRALPELLQHGVIGLNFPKWRDGRAYSSARILRELGFAGDIRAVGDLTLDQLVFLKRAGFSSLAPERPIDPVQAAAALERFQFVYQRAADGAQPAFSIRNG
jgi:uncharacterized protein (DUF934 family)